MSDITGKAKNLLSSWSGELDAPTEELRVIEALLDKLKELEEDNKVQQAQINVLRETNKLLDEMVSDKGIDKLLKVFEAAEDMDLANSGIFECSDGVVIRSRKDVMNSLAEALQDYKENE